MALPLNTLCYTLKLTTEVSNRCLGKLFHMSVIALQQTRKLGKRTCEASGPKYERPGSSNAKSKVLPVITYSSTMP
jgi:hypothetical protein